MELSLEALRLREKELSLDAVMIRGRIEECRHMISVLEATPRRGRPRKPAEACERSAAVVIVPKRVEGGIADADVEDNMRAIDEVRGILRSEESAA